MLLSREILKKEPASDVTSYVDRIFEFPEKVIQFGTGVLLRGLPDYIIDKANKMGIFNGRIVAIKTTDAGDVSAFNEQDGLFTLCVRGIQNGLKIEENIINASISRVLNANYEWQEVLKCAYNPDLQVIISNTTEIGIELVPDDILCNPPVSYPCKLLAFLFERYKAFNGRKDSGFVIVPTELIPHNGRKLKSITIEQARLNTLSDKFIEWLETCNYFCDSLVDRIVTGMPGDEIRNTIEKKLGYEDRLMTVCEAYRLWAIEGDELTKRVLSFCEADEGMTIEPSIDLYSELKLRLLNGTHTLTCSIAILGGFDTVKNTMDDALMENFICQLMQLEIGPSITCDVNKEVLQIYIAKVLDRFRNEDIHHYWTSIARNFSSKMSMRCIPVLMGYYKQYKSVPDLFALAFASFIRYLKPVKLNGDRYFGQYNDEFYLIEDQNAELFYWMWQKLPVDKLITEVLKNTALWEEDLLAVSGLHESIHEKLIRIMRYGVREAVKYSQWKNVFV